MGRPDDGDLVSFGYKPKPDDAKPLALRSRSTGDLPIASLFSRTSPADPLGLWTPKPSANALQQMLFSNSASDATSESSTEVKSAAEPTEN